LELVPAPPRGGRVVPALLFVVLLIGAIGFPTFRAVAEGPPEAIAWAPRPLPAAHVPAIDPIRTMPEGTRPTSSEPAGGVLFVRCTNLWRAHSDGSHARRLLAFTGASSPTFSPDARTVAFIGPTDEGRGLFMVGADGSRVTEVGSFLSGGTPLAARIANLTWAPSGNKLAFALVDPSYDPLVGGSTIWMLDLTTGEFHRVAGGWPSPAFINNRVVFPRWAETASETGASFWTQSGSWRDMARRLSSPGADYTLATAPDQFSDAWSTKHGAIVLQAGDHGAGEIATKGSYWTRRVTDTFAAPSPYRFLTTGRLSLSQDASYAVADLIDPKGDRALGILEFSTRDWTVLDYAWSGVATPAPTATNSIAAQRAKRLAGDVLGSWRRNGSTSAAAYMVGDDRDPDLVPSYRGGYMVGAPERTATGWVVPATVYGRGGGSYSFRNINVILDETDDERVEADVEAISAPRALETIEDAKAFVADVMGDELAFVWPTHLPEGTRLNLEWPVDAYSWDGRTTAPIHMLLPKADGEKYDRTLNVAYGDVSFSLGCGGEMDPYEGEINGRPALFDHMGDDEFATRQVLWPGTLDARDIGTYSVYGELPEAELKAIAESMAGS
jgi:hypothetical protein